MNSGATLWFCAIRGCVKAIVASLLDSFSLWGALQK